MNNKILITDDDAPFRESIAKVLEIVGYDVYEANNGVEAMRIIGMAEIDLLITDILMPEMDGIKLFEAAKNLYPEFIIIGMSGGGNPSTDLIDSTTEQLFDNFFTKPFAREKLLEAVASLIGTPCGSGAV